MIIAELLFLGLLILGAIRGYKNGGVQGLADIVASVVGFIVARKFYPIMAKVMALVIPGDNQSLAQLFGFLVVFMMVWKIIGGLLGIGVSLLKIVTTLPIISLINKLAGSILGLILMVIFIGATSYIVMSAQLDPTLIKWFGSSEVARYCQQSFMKILFFLI